VVLGTTNALPAVPLVLSGGTFSTGGLAQGTGGTLGLGSSSTLDLGAAAFPTSVNFANSRTSTWTGTLTISGWTYLTDQLFIGSGNSGPAVDAGLTVAQLSQIQFADFHQGASISTSGEVTPLIGDIDQNGFVNTADINAMLVALTDVNFYQASKSFTASDTLFELDMNRDGSISNFDIQAMLDYIASSGSGSVSAIPEPSSMLLLGMGSALLIAIRIRKRHAT
jgi:hypothetical protein